MASRKKGRITSPLCGTHVWSMEEIMGIFLKKRKEEKRRQSEIRANVAEGTLGRRVNGPGGACLPSPVDSSEHAVEFRRLLGGEHFALVRRAFV